MVRLSAQLARYIIDDVIECMGWLVADHASGLFEIGHASLHVLKTGPVYLFVGNEPDLAGAASQVDRSFCKGVDRDLLVISQIDDGAEASGRFDQFGQSF